MPVTLGKRDPNQHDPIAWHDDPSGGARGVIANHTTQPYIIDVTKDGRFDVYTLTKADTPKHVTSGRANNVSRAKSKARTQAIANIKELQAALHTDIIDTQAKPVRQQGQAAWVMTLKIYIGLALSVAAVVIFARWLFVYRPVLALRVLAWVVGCGFAAHKILAWLEHLDKRRERLARRRVLDLQAALTTKGKGKR